MTCTSDSCSLSGSGTGWSSGLLLSAVFSCSRPFRRFFRRPALAISSGVVLLRKAMRLPSGDHTGWLAPLGRSVMVQASPPPSGRIAICGGVGLPISSLSPPRTNAMEPPSRDQRAPESCLPLVIRIGAVLPLVATVQMEVSYPVRLSSTITRVNATRRPSGESCGSVIHVNRKRSLSLMGRLAAEPGADADDGLGALV